VCDRFFHTISREKCSCHVLKKVAAPGSKLWHLTKKFNLIRLWRDEGRGKYGYYNYKGNKEGEKNENRNEIIYCLILAPFPASRI
jgi:starvation-inducible outer membrane lipoprotein